jgi:hypothetical protein
VVAGADVGNGRYFCCADLIDATVPPQPTDLAAAVEAVTDHTPTGRITWLGIGALTNLASLASRRPDLARGLDVTQMGGGPAYRDRTRAEHNIGLDVAAARAVLDRVKVIRFVPSELTFRHEIEIGADSELYRTLEGPWASLVRANFDRWFATFHATSMQHDPLALSAALTLPFVEFAAARVVLDAAGRMTAAPDGTPVWLGSRANYAAFLRWLHRALGLPAPPGAAERPSSAASRTRHRSPRRRPPTSGRHPAARERDEDAAH